MKTFGFKIIHSSAGTSGGEREAHLLGDWRRRDTDGVARPTLYHHTRPTLFNGPSDAEALTDQEGSSGHWDSRACERKAEARSLG